ncbi:Ivy1p ASCRUDRAFT_31681, partial [Ascoidea rubescens DSM 1968]
MSTLDSTISFTPSVLDLPTIITKKDIKSAESCYNKLLKTAQSYKDSLLSTSNAASDFGAALEDCARCKGSGNAADGLMSAAGFHYIISNHQQLLSQAIYINFEKPVKNEIDAFNQISATNNSNFKNKISEKINELKFLEYQNSKISKSRFRNLVNYKSTLSNISRKIQEIDNLKHDYYLSCFSLVQATSSKILTRVSSIVRAQVEIFDGIARKGWSGGGLDDLIATCPDPFANSD